MVYDADWKDVFVPWLLHMVSLGGIIVLYEES